MRSRSDSGSPRIVTSWFGSEPRGRSPRSHESFLPTTTWGRCSSRSKHGFVSRESGHRGRRSPFDHGRNRGGGRITEILIPITRRIRGVADIEVVTTPPALVATTIERGDYPGLSRAGSWARKWAAATGHMITGPAWVVYIRFSAEPELNVPESFLTDEPSEYVTEIQVPIERLPG